MTEKQAEMSSGAKYAVSWIWLLVTAIIGTLAGVLVYSASKSPHAAISAAVFTAVLVVVLLLFNALKNNERTLRASAELFHALFENDPDAIVVVSTKGHIVRINAGAEKLFGYQRAELIGQPLDRLVPETARELHQQHFGNFANAPHRREIGAVADLSGRRKDGSEFAADIVLSPLTIDDELLVLAVVRDISERKRAERALQTQVRVLESMDEGVVVTNAAGVIVYTNPALERAFGYLPGELAGQPLALLNAERDESVLTPVMREVATRGLWRGEFRSRRQDGTPFISEACISSLLIDGQQHFVSVQQDITERRRLEREILEISNREQSRIGRDLHDGLCQQLVSLAFLSTRLERKLQAQERPETREATAIAGAIDGLIEQTRGLARVLYPVKLEAEGLSAALQELAAQIGHFAGVTCDFDCPVPATLDNLAVATHVYRIAQEAVTNALKHGHATHLVIGLCTDDDHLHLTVQDNGVGFPTPPNGHAGMGVNTMRYRARMIGGTLEIRSQPRETIIGCRCPRSFAR